MPPGSISNTPPIYPDGPPSVPTRSLTARLISSIPTPKPIKSVSTAPSPRTIHHPNKDWISLSFVRGGFFCNAAQFPGMEAGAKALAGFYFVGLVEDFAGLGVHRDRVAAGED